MKQLLFVAIAGAVLLGNQLVHAGEGGCSGATGTCETPKDETARTGNGTVTPSAEKEKAPKEGEKKPVS